MQKLADLATTEAVATPSAPGLRKTAKPQPRKADAEIKALFERLRAIYPHFARKLTASELKSMAREWAEELAAYSERTIAETVLVFRVSHPFAPNSVAEFVAVCKTIRARERAIAEYRARMRAREHARPRTAAEREHARNHLSRAREAALRSRGGSP